MKAAAKANGTAETAKRRIKARAFKLPAVSLAMPKINTVFKDRYLVEGRSGGRPILLRAWHQAAGVFGAGVALVCLLSLTVAALTNQGHAGPADYQKRNAEIQVALDLMGKQIQNQQAALFDLAAMERGLILVDSREIDIETLMAENERLLSTLNTALALSSDPVQPSAKTVGSPVETAAIPAEQVSEDVHVLSRELELNKTRTALLNAELEIERETIEKLAEELALSRQETRALERETLRLNNAIEGRDDTIALLKKDVIALQTGQTDTDAARRRAVQLLNEENAELTAEITDVRSQIERRTLQLKSLEARLAQSEADTTRLNSLLVQREEQISSLTEAQNLILDRLETKVKEQTASLEKAIDATGIDYDTRIDLDAILDSITDPLWNGMGGSIDEAEIEVEEFAVASDGTTDKINDLFDRALMVERMADELAQRQAHFDSLPTYRPVSGLRLSSGYGMRKHPISGKYRMHKGLDFAGPSGSRVSAAGPGKVIYAARKGSYGNLVEIDHGNGVISRYAHLRKISVKKGVGVIVGQKIGEVGSTGASTGPHLHWEVLVFDKAQDPQKFLNARKSLN